ncbi:MAG: TerC family protein [Acidobacteriota bacterium]|nr:MAG: TerC family protein [Acidobacteriota bacterium]
MTWITQPEAWIALATLTAIEIVLGIDNIIFISIMTGRLLKSQQQPARLIGLILAMAMRIGLLFSLAWIIRLTAPLFSLLGQEISGRDLILIGGGLFLLGKSTHEIHKRIEDGPHESTAVTASSMPSVLIQITLLDIVFSLDSVITAVGMAEHLSVMVLAIVIAVGFMMLFARAIGDFVERHPTIKMLALAFLILIGVVLIADGLDQHIPKGYIYFSMAFSVFVEMLNLRVRHRRQSAHA